MLEYCPQQRAETSLVSRRVTGEKEHQAQTFSREDPMM